MINFSLNTCWRLIPTKTAFRAVFFVFLCIISLFIPYLFVPLQAENKITHNELS